MSCQVEEEGQVLRLENIKLRKEKQGLIDQIRLILVGEPVMDPILAQALLQVGLVLIVKLIKGDTDTSDLERSIIEAQTRDDLKELAINEAIKALSSLPDEPSPLIDDLVSAGGKDDVIAAISKPENKVGLIQGIADFIGRLLGL